MRRSGFVALFICLIVVLTACAVEGEAAEGSVAVSPIIPTVTPTASPSVESAVSPEPTPNTNEILIEERDTARWKMPNGDYVEAELTYVSLAIDPEERIFYDEYLLLTLRCDGERKDYRLEANGILPGYYLFPCNVTGGNRDLLITKGTTSIGIEIWTYELFIVNDDLTLALVNDDTRVPQPSIRVNKTTTDERVVVTVEGDNGTKTIVDIPLPLDSTDWLESGVYYLEEGDSIADLFHSEEVITEDINGDGIDELRLFFDLGDYKCWYGDVTAWMSYDDGEWSTAKLEFERYDGQ